MRAILTYHSIDASGSPISIAPETFARHVAWLAGGAVQVESLTALRDGGEVAADGRHRVAITFDDAFENFGTVAWPRLREAGLPVTLFVVTGHVGRTNVWGGRPSPGIPALPLMTWDALAVAASEGVTIGAHTRTHPHLPDLTAAQVDEELAGSRDDLARHLGCQATTFAYPYGDVSPAATAAAARHFAASCTTDYRPVSAGDAPERLPRLDMGYFQRADAMADWGTAAFVRRIAMRRALRRARGWWSRR
ncbi:MAG: polysaccharide deacetylase family protein [Vicinamibacterales bacterium]